LEYFVTDFSDPSATRSGVVIVNGRRCERLVFKSGEVRYYAQASDVRFPTFRLVPRIQKHFRRKIDEAINGDLTEAPKSV